VRRELVRKIGKLYECGKLTFDTVQIQQILRLGYEGQHDEAIATLTMLLNSLDKSVFGVGSC